MQRGVGAVRLGQHVRRGALEEGQPPTSSTIAGTNWIALAPVPTTATRCPVRSWSWSQRAEWNAVPGTCRARAGRAPSAGAAGRARGPARRPRSPRRSRCAPSSCRPPRRTPRRSPRRRCARGRGCRPRRRCAAGRRGSRAGGRSGATSPGSARTSTSTATTGRRRRARVGVVAPDATDLVGLLEHGDVADAGPEQLGGDPEAAEAGADDDDAGPPDGLLTTGSPGQAMVMPPSTGRVWPVTYPAAGGKQHRGGGELGRVPGPAGGVPMLPG